MPRSAVDALVERCGNSHAVGRGGKPEEVANMIAFLASKEASFVTGNTTMVDGDSIAIIHYKTDFSSG